MVGQHPDARQRAGRQHPRRGHRPLLDDPARRAGQGAQCPDRFLQATRSKATARTGRPTLNVRWSRSPATRPGDTTVTYDKGGWVFWMLLNQMGRDRALAGMQAFIKTYHGNSDHPVLQDFLASMRPFAADAAAFDAFTHQWFFEVVVPEYRLQCPEKDDTRS